MASSMHILIIGAGSTGLLIAQGLKQAGVSFSIFEREDVETYKDRARLWTMALHWGRPFIAQLLPNELMDKLQETETDPALKMTPEQETSVPIINGKTGEKLSMMPGDSTRKVNRTKLRALFAEGIDVQYGKKAVSFEDHGKSITVLFADSSTATGSAVVACDSINSTLRSYLLKPENNVMETHPMLVWNFTHSFTAGQAQHIRGFYHPTIQLYLAHPDQRTRCIIQPADIVDPDRPETWIFQIILSVLGTDQYPKENTDRVKLFKQLAANYCEPVRSIAEWVNNDTWMSPDKFIHWQSPTRWPNHGGRMTLAGDAAHPMAPCKISALLSLGL